MNYKLLRYVLFFAFDTGWLLLLSMPAIAQQNRKHDYAKQLFSMPPQFFRFVLIAGVAQKASHNNTEGNYPVGSSVQPCWEGGVDYLHTISGTFYYGLGVHMAVTGRSTVFRTPALASNPAAHYEQSPSEKDRQFDPVLAVPLLVEKQWVLTPRKALYADLDIQLNLAVSSEYSGFGLSLQDSSGNDVQVYNQNAQAYYNGKPWLSYKIGGGMLWALKNENLLGIGVVVTFCFTDFMQGTYEVKLPDMPNTRGIFKADGSYAGIEISYGLTGRFIRKLRDGKPNL